MSMQAKIEKVTLRQGPLKRWHKTVIGLSILVVFCTVYALIKPAMAVSPEQAKARELINSYETIATNPDDNRIIASGEIKNGIRWTVIEDNEFVRTLVFTGEGKLDNRKDGTPWRDGEFEKITKVVFGEGVIPSSKSPTARENPFTICSKHENKIQEIYFSTTMDNIGHYYGTFPNLSKVTFAGDVKYFNLNFFEGNEAFNDYLVLPYDAIVYSSHPSLYSKKLGRTPLGGIRFVKEDGTVGNEGKYYIYHDDTEMLVTKGDKCLIAYLGEYKDKLVLPEYVKRVENEYVDTGQMDAMQGDYVTRSDTMPNVRILTFPRLNLEDCYYCLDEATNLEHLTVGTTPLIPTLIDYDENDLKHELFSLNVKNPDYVKAIDSEAFYGMTNFSIDLKPYTDLEYIGDNAFQYNLSLEDVYIGKKVEGLGDQVFADCGYIDGTLYYNARSMHNLYEVESIFENTRFAKGVLGKDVREVENAMLQVMLDCTDNYEFVPDHTFISIPSDYDIETVFRQGFHYVDKDGVVYNIDGTTREASLVFVPSSCNKLVVPAKLSNGYKVVGVNPKALKYAKSLKSLDFENKDGIRVLRDGCFSEAPNLEKINGKNNSLEIEDTFKNADLGKNMYESSPKIKTCNEQVVNKESLQYKSGNKTLTIKSYGDQIADEMMPKKGDKFIFFTGQEVTHSLSLSCGDNNLGTAFRIYFKFDDEKGRTNLNEGTNIFDDLKCTYKKADKPNTYVLESEVIKTGGTFGTTFKVFYPNIKSDGGRCIIWGELLSEEELKNSEAKASLSYDTERYDLRWVTRPIRYKVKPKVDDKYDVVGGGKQGDKLKIKGAYIPVYGEIDSEKSEHRNHNLGKDPVVRVDWYNEVKLDEGMEWDHEFVEAVKKNRAGSHVISTLNEISYKDSKGRWKTAANIYEYKLEGKKGVPYRNPSYLKSSWDLRYDETKDAIVLVGKQIMLKDDYLLEKHFGNYQYRFAFDQDIILMDKPSSIDDAKGKAITCDSTIKTHYKFGRAYESQPSTSVIKGSVAKEKISLMKKRVETGKYYGDKVLYKLSVHNEGIFDYDAKKVSDFLDQNLYISPESMAEMFVADEGENLEITIDKATLAKTPVKREEVALVDGGKGYKSNATNSVVNDYDSSPVKNDPNEMRSEGGKENKLVCSIDGKGNFKVTTSLFDGKKREATGVYDNKHELAKVIRKCLDEVGFVPDVHGLYGVTWNKSTAAKVNGGSSKDYFLHCNVKNTYGLLGSDRPGRHAVSEFEIPSNEFSVGDMKFKERDLGFKVEYEHYLYHKIRDNGELVDLEEESVEPGTVLDYEVGCFHRGNSQVDVLPAVTKLDGALKLLVPIEGNSQFEGFKTFDDKYYVLNKGGTYRNVDYNGQIIDEITVDEEGDRTIIKAYFTSVKDFGVDSISYKTLVDNSDRSRCGYFVYASWLNDHDSHRLNVSAMGTILEFKKKIVEKRGASPDEDVLVENDYKGIVGGDKVTYRFALRNTANYPLILGGEDLYDVLPETLGYWKWNNDNVKLEYVKEDDSKIALVNEDHYSISAPSDGQQEIVFAEDFEVKYSSASTLYVYVTLDFPSGETFEKYDEKLSGAMISNTLYVYKMISKVYHDVVSPGKVGFQKGVLFTGLVDNSIVNDDMRNVFASGRNATYGNLDIVTGKSEHLRKNHKAIFYVTVVNTGNSKLPLNEIEDILPPGFLFQGVSIGGVKNNFEDAGDNKIKRSGDVDAYRGNEGNGKNNWNGSIISKEGDDKAVKNMDYHIDTTVGEFEPMGQKVKFKIKPSESGSDSVAYDEISEKCYLMKNQAITIVYKTAIMGSDHYENGKLKYGTVARSTNKASMSFDDPYEIGVELDEDVKVKGNSKYFSVTTAEGLDAEKMPLNDGKSSILNNKVAENAGFSKDEEGRKRIYSDVLLERDEIKPGINKSVDKRVSVSGEEIPYDGYADYTDTIRWKLSLTNDSASDISNCYIEDVVEYPHFFTGDVVMKNQDESTETVLFTIGEMERGLFREEVPIYIREGMKNETYMCKVGGPPVSCCNIQIDKTAKKDYRLRFELGEYKSSKNSDSKKIRVNKKNNVDIFLNTKNMLDDHRTHVYTNNANLRLPDYEFENNQVIEGQPLDDQQGKYINATAGVSVMSSQQTTSKISIEEVYGTGDGMPLDDFFDFPSRKVSSLESPNYLTVRNQKDELNYYLTVKNNSDENINGMVLLTNFPEEGDNYTFSDSVSRNSQFKVDIDMTRNVEVKGARGKPLSPEHYILEYSTKTEFDENDWNGEQGGWTTEKIDGARSVRVIIKEDFTIDRNTPLEVIVPGRIASGYVPPGGYAWCTFGYRYKTSVDGEPLEAGPGRVGLKISELPSVEKNLVSVDRPWIAEKDEICTFVVYEHVNWYPYDLPLESKEETEGMLVSEGAKYAFYEIKVPKGESKVNKILGERRPSDSIEELKKHEDVAMPTNQSNFWIWDKNAKYILLEVENSDDFKYSMTNGRPANYFEFEYDHEEPPTVKYVNELEKWSIDITKVSRRDSGKKLEGAVFGLYGHYSEKERIKKSDAEEKYGIKIDSEVDCDNASYPFQLLDVGATDENGKLSFADLKGEKYIIKELKEPDGFVLNSDPIEVTVKDTGGVSTTVDLELPNSPSLILPKTGGPGKFAFVALGLALMGASVRVALKRNK